MGKETEEKMVQENSSTALCYRSKLSPLETVALSIFYPGELEPGIWFILFNSNGRTEIISTLVPLA